MSTTVKCPECGAVMAVPDEFLGKRLRCKSCKAVFQAPAPDLEVDEDRPPTRGRTARRDGDQPGGRADKEERSAPRTERAKARRDRDEGDEDEPDDDRPARKGKGARKKLSVPYLIGLVLAFLLAAGAVYWVYTTWRDSNRNAGDPGGGGAKSVTGGLDPDVAARNPRAAALKLGTPPGMVGQHVELSPPTAAPTADGGVELTVPYEFLGDRRPGKEYVIVVVRADGWAILPTAGAGMPAGPRDQFKVTVGPEARRGVEVWIGRLGPNPDVYDPGLRVSNIVRHN